MSLTPAQIHAKLGTGWPVAFYNIEAKGWLADVNLQRDDGLYIRTSAEPVYFIGKRQEDYDRFELYSKRTGEYILQHFNKAGSDIVMGKKEGGTPFYIDVSTVSHLKDVFQMNFSALALQYTYTFVVVGPHYSDTPGTHWKILFGEATPRLTDMSYQLGKAVIKENPEILKSISLVNKTDTLQQMSSSYEKRVSKSHLWNWKFGGKVSVEAGGKAGIPFVAEGTVKVAVEASVEYTFGEEKTVQNANIETVNCNVPARSSVEVRMIVYRQVIDVPYTAKVSWDFENGSVLNMEVNDTYHGVDATRVHVSYESPVSIDAPIDAPN